MRYSGLHTKWHVCVSRKRPWQCICCLSPHTRSACSVQTERGSAQSIATHRLRYPYNPALFLIDLGNVTRATQHRHAISFPSLSLSLALRRADCASSLARSLCFTTAKDTRERLVLGEVRCFLYLWRMAWSRPSPTDGTGRVNAR